MILSITKAAAAITTFIFLLFLASLWILLPFYIYNDQVASFSLMPVFEVFLVSALVVVVARATMMAWITVLVMLTFAGNRRWVLVRRGRLIAYDVAIYLFRIIVKETGLLAVVCATILSLMAMLGLTF